MPEVVPFRLTQNIVDGFGPLGTEGPFRISCEVALRMMRNQKDLLMSVLRPFIFDPLVDWTIKGKSNKEGEEGNRPPSLCGTGRGPAPTTKPNPRACPRSATRSCGGWVWWCRPPRQLRRTRGRPRSRRGGRAAARAAAETSGPCALSQ